ncbi:MAG TPA: response regulator [Candidatus Sumerlaeia bacterium]|nr:response regulator [Candidatus Sumerlaeia bacterium]
MPDEKRILIIDDEPLMVNSLADLLNYGDYIIDRAYSGKDGIEHIKTAHYSLVITDLRMKDISGFDVIDYIKSHSPTTVIIIITGHASTESAIQALQLGAFDYVTKPFDFDLIRNAVEKAFDKIEAENLRDEMIHMITHDIKIPLTSIIGFAGLIFDRQTGDMTTGAHHYVSSINANAQKILSLIDNFLASCKIKTGKLAIYESDVNVDILVKDLVEIMMYAIEKRNISLKTEIQHDLPVISGDNNLLFRAFGNILNNAVKYTPDDGRIEIRVRSVSAENSPLWKPSLEFSVSNTGPGIPADELSDVFDRYQRCSSSIMGNKNGKSVRGIEGSGLGLFVVKHVVQAHKGVVSVDSIAGQITTFSIHLPLKQE